VVEPGLNAAADFVCTTLEPVRNRMSALSIGNLLSCAGALQNNARRKLDEIAETISPSSTEHDLVDSALDALQKSREGAKANSSFRQQLLAYRDRLEEEERKVALHLKDVRDDTSTCTDFEEGLMVRLTDSSEEHPMVCSGHVASTFCPRREDPHGSKWPVFEEPQTPEPMLSFPLQVGKLRWCPKVKNNTRSSKASL